MMGTVIYFFVMFLGSLAWAIAGNSLEGQPLTPMIAIPFGLIGAMMGLAAALLLPR